DLLLRAAETTDVVFDKTGTLTAGRPELVSLAVQPRAAAGPEADSTEARLLAIAAALETGQPHPVAEAIRRAAAGAALPAATEARTWPGLGVQARIDGRLWRLGNASFAGAAPSGASADAPGRGNGPADDADPGDTVICLADETGPVARLRLRDAL